MIRDYLQKLGLSDKEITLYLAILQKGRVGVNIVSQVTGINRTTVYSVAKDLESKGYIILDLGVKPNMLIAIPPEQLRSLVERQRNVVENLIPELNAISQNTGFSVPKIKFVPEVDLESYLYSETDRWDSSLKDTDKTIWGVQDPDFSLKYTKWIEWYYSRTIAKEHSVKMITSQSKEKKEVFEGRDLLNLAPDLDFNSAIWVWGDYIIMVSYKGKPNYLVEIYDKNLAHNMKELFRGVWLKSDIK